MTVERFLVGKLRNEEWFNFHTTFSDLVERCGADVLQIGELYPVYRTYYRKADRLLEVLQKSFATAGTTSADRKRDLAFRGLRNVVKAYLHALDKTKQTAAVKVHAVIRKYSNAITRSGVSARTGAIDNLLQDLTATGGGIDLSQEALLLGLGEWVNNLGITQEAYKTSLIERSEEATGRPNVGELPKVRAVMNHYYVNMVNVVDARLLAISAQSGEGDTASGTTPGGDVIHFARTLNFYILHYKSLLKGRRTRGVKKEKTWAEEMPE